ncbi:MAG: tetratricopeptide repeat protein, partial [Phycisphaerae bacterium]
MAQLTIPQAFARAVQHQQAGQLAEAEQIYRQILAQQPGQVETLYQLGVLAYQAGRPEAAVELLRQVVAMKPQLAEAHCNLGKILREMGRLEEAVAACRQALVLKPHFPEACYNLGVALSDMGDGLLEEAVAAYQRAIELKPDFAEAYCNLGSALRKKGLLEAAEVAYREASARKPDFPEAHSNLGVVLQERGQLAEAGAACERAVALKPDYAEAHYNLGNVLQELGRPDEAIAAYRRAIALKADYAAAYSNLGNALKDRGEVEEAVAAFRRALELQPDFVTAGSSLVYTLHFHSGYDAWKIDRENRRWNRRHAAVLGRVSAPHGHGRAAGRRLKIGYVSPDFYQQAEAFFTVPLLAHHDHAGFEIYCYSSVRKPDQVTQRLRKCADGWREVRHLNDEALAQMIRRDGIDILVDLTMHMAGNRALVFARKPAPVQVCWLAYPGGTGLGTMDYRLTDSFMDEVGADTSCYAEKSVRLPDCWVVYDPLIELAPRP